MAEIFPVSVENLGHATLEGTGPWSVRDYGPGAFTIVDAAGKSARTSMRQFMKKSAAFKDNANVIFSKRADADAVVEACNTALEKVA